MDRPRRRFLQLAGAAVLAGVPGAFAPGIWVPGAVAQSYPARPVRWIVSFAAGGANDIVARLVGQFLSEKLGQQIIVEDRGGAGGNIGMAAVLSAPPDGYTIGFVAPNNAINATLYDKLPYDFIRDSAPVAGTMLLTNVLVVHPSVPAKDLKEFIALLKAKPGDPDVGHLTSLPRSACIRSISRPYLSSLGALRTAATAACTSPEPRSLPNGDTPGFPEASGGGGAVMLEDCRSAALRPTCGSPPASCICTAET